ncbi:MAG TPA: hypothetical protein VGS09_02025 [Actinomycetota bacterium]|jgi:hypothetical protein|nr:hypothetical protein [Actinomycetota bacterium]
MAPIVWIVNVSSVPGSSLSCIVTKKITSPEVVLASPVMVVVQPGLKLVMEVLLTLRSGPWSTCSRLPTT